MKHFVWSYREDGSLTSISSNAAECLALRFLSSLPSDCVSFFLSFGHLLELSSGLPLLYDETSHLKKIETESVKVVGPWPALHVSMNKVQHMHMYFHTYMLESPFVTSYSKAAAFSSPIQINIHLQLACFLITSHHLLVGLGFDF